VEGHLEQAFRRHYSEIYRYLRRRSGDHDVAEDLAQQVFLDAAVALRFDGRPPSAWLYTVAKRRFADEARRRARVSVAGLDELANRETEYGPAVAEALLASFAQLPAPQREVLVMKLVRGLSYGEIASILGVSVEAVRMRFSRALRTVRDDLEEGGIRNDSHRS
jgi:RNA polymerase sigma-70 factor (ECF subfamily)